MHPATLKKIYCNKILILILPLELFESGLKDHLWIFLKVVYFQRHPVHRKLRNKKNNYLRFLIEEWLFWIVLIVEIYCTIGPTLSCHKAQFRLVFLAFAAVLWLALLNSAKMSSDSTWKNEYKSMYILLQGGK